MTGSVFCAVDSQSRLEAIVTELKAAGSPAQEVHVFPQEPANRDEHVPRALLRIGIPLEEAVRYSTKIERGNYVISVVHASDDARRRIISILERRGATDISHTTQARLAR